MNIEFIKSEIERLSLIVEQWRDGEQIPAIERDLALDKIKSLYGVLRFGDSQDYAPQETMASVMPPVVPTSDNEVSITEEETEETSSESDVEVEFIFAEDDEFSEELMVEDEPQEDELASEEPTDVDTPIVELSMVNPVENIEESARERPVESNEEQKPIEASRAESVKTHDDVTSINSLFGEEEPRRKPRSKHQRMMSIYNDDATHEKVVDISKIFDMDADDEELEIISSPSVETKRQQSSRRMDDIEDAKINIAPTLADAKTVTLADAMAQNTATLADTIEAPAALGEEINHSHIKSLRKAIGINDKFLMIRDLFDGDGDVYEKTLDALDGFESFDDCLLYIAENHPEWNPDSEGAKFLTQLLERKLL